MYNDGILTFFKKYLTPYMMRFFHKRTSSDQKRFRKLKWIINKQIKIKKDMTSQYI